MATIASLPPELLEIIFSYSLPPLEVPRAAKVSSVPYDVEPWTLEGAWTLSHVCRYWRAVTFSLPWLWSSFCIRSNIPPKQQNLLKLQLSRSRTTPLDIVLVINSRTKLARQPTIPVLIESCMRWRYLCLFLAGTVYVPYLDFGNRDLAFPSLETLVLGGEAINSIYHHPFTETTAPRLTSLVVSGLESRALAMGGLNRRLSLPLPWIPIYTHDRLERMADTIVDADLRFLPPNAMTDWSGGELQLPNLRRLITNDISILEYATAPALEELHLHHLHSTRTQDFLIRSGCDLRRLFLVSCFAEADIVLGILLVAQTVKHLAIDYAIDADPREPEQALLQARKVQRALTIAGEVFPGAPGLFCPQLVSLVWSDANGNIILRP
ncbi:hypothetical protein MKEN_00706800 [Mycena kentingensis (nom. inval.)]|nr:hypothetical protein MKEN_00706800 [Mycena kentingensis (nom. inval.)]